MWKVWSRPGLGTHICWKKRNIHIFSNNFLLSHGRLWMIEPDVTVLFHSILLWQWFLIIWNKPCRPAKLLEIIKQRFLSSGGTIFEGHGVSSIEIYEDAAVCFFWIYLMKENGIVIIQIYELNQNISIII